MADGELLGRGRQKRRQVYDPTRNSLDDGLDQGRHEAPVLPFLDWVVARERARFLMLMFRYRGFAVGADGRAKIEGCLDLELLNEWIEVSLTAGSVEEVLSLAWCATDEV